MATIRLDVVTAERLVLSEDVDIVIAPGIEGQLGILPHHAPLMTLLDAGELIARKGQEEISLAVAGGFLEVGKDRVIVLADIAERAEEINVEEAEEARKRAETALAEKKPGFDALVAEAALRASLARLKVAAKRRKKTPLV
jgi:F-type H+-transporting ATPase subunit epsilon